MYMKHGGSINLFMIQDLEGVNNSRPITPGGNFAIGKWLTPYVGLRLEFSGAKYDTWTIKNDAWEKLKLGYLGVYGDFMWNASNTFAGYNEKRVVSIIPFAGISTNTSVS